MEAILTALIGGACVAVPSIIATMVGNSKTIYRLEQLEKKVEKHNNIVERTYRLEDDIKYIKEDIQELKHVWIKEVYYERCYN